MTEWDRSRWPEALLKADEDRNAGMAMELFSADGYAKQDGVTTERYVINILRAERERRQELDRIARDKLWLDEVIDGALAEGITPQEWIARRLSESKFSNGAEYRPEDVSAQFLAQLSNRLLERLAEAHVVTHDWVCAPCGLTYMSMSAADIQHHMASHREAAAL